MKHKIKDIKETLPVVKDGDTIMVGGFLQCANPQSLIRALTQTSAGGAGNLFIYGSASNFNVVMATAADLIVDPDLKTITV